MGISLSRLSFAATMGMVYRIHHYTAHIRTSAQPSRPTCLPNIDILVIRIPNLSDGCHAGRKNSPHFTGPESHLHIFTVTSHHLSRPACATYQLSAFSRLQLYVMDGSS
jgi:hypothetical protein